MACCANLIVCYGHVVRPANLPRSIALTVARHPTRIKSSWYTLMCFQLGHYLLHISFSLETFSKVYAGGRPLPLHHYSSTTIKVWLPDSRGHTLYERNTNCGICGVSAPVFLRRRHILAGLQCAE